MVSLKMVLVFRNPSRCLFVRGSLLCVILSITCNLYAEDIYKLTDEHGNVTYSSEPPATGQATEMIQAPPAPAEADVEAARQRQEKIEDDFERLDQARAEQAEREAQQQTNNTTTVVQTNTVIGAGPRFYPHGGYWRGAPAAPGAPTAPGYRPPGYHHPGHRPRLPIAVPYDARPRRRSGS